MTCYCCSRKKKLFESFVELDTTYGVLRVCAECNDLLYKLRDDSKDNNSKKYAEHLNKLNKRKKEPNELYSKWEKEFLSKNPNPEQSI